MGVFILNRKKSKSFLIVQLPVPNCQAFCCETGCTLKGNLLLQLHGFKMASERHIVQWLNASFHFSDFLKPLFPLCDSNDSNIKISAPVMIFEKKKLTTQSPSSASTFLFIALCFIQLEVVAVVWMLNRTVRL